MMLSVCLLGAAACGENEACIPQEPTPRQAVPMDCPECPKTDEKDECPECPDENGGRDGGEDDKLPPHPRLPDKQGWRFTPPRRRLPVRPVPTPNPQPTM